MLLNGGPRCSFDLNRRSHAQIQGNARHVHIVWHSTLRSRGQRCAVIANRSRYVRYWLRPQNHKHIRAHIHVHPHTNTRTHIADLWAKFRPKQCEALYRWCNSSRRTNKLPQWHFVVTCPTQDEVIVPKVPIMTLIKPCRHEWTYVLTSVSPWGVIMIQKYGSVFSMLQFKSLPPVFFCRSVFVFDSPSYPSTHAKEHATLSYSESRVI